MSKTKPEADIQLDLTPKEALALYVVTRHVGGPLGENNNLPRGCIVSIQTALYPILTKELVIDPASLGIPATGSVRLSDWGDTNVGKEKTELITVSGYECPIDTSLQAKKALIKLRIFGAIHFTHDDGPSLLVRQELEDIASAIGLTCYTHPYEVRIVDDSQAHKIDGANDT